ncbi:hypothetical protein [Vibrio agarivorans]|uniref:hypothetical protein n=1 Tax=Vibrio agarivorans TaxID=153622 RepID=UPI0025B3295B|nr:hypothetical protein [Vibrio agarivorans]MDN3663373.1 hypothetical protein [Vibrio agarivorans]
MDSRDIVAIGLLENWLSQEQISELKEAHDANFNPMSVMPELHAIPTNTPFVMLSAYQH